MTLWAACGPSLAAWIMAHPVVVADPRIEPSSRVVLVLRPASADDVTAEATARVEGELHAAGFRVSTLPLDGPDARHDVETEGADLHPLAAFAIVVQPGAGASGPIAEIWVSDRVREKTVIQRAQLSPADHPRDSEILAVSAVELLKASLAEFWIGAQAPAASVPTAPARPASPPPAPGPAAAVPSAPAPEKPVAPAPSPSTRRAFGAGFEVALGFAVIEGFEHAAPVWLPSIDLAYGSPSGWGVRADLRGFGPAVTLASENGSAKVEEQLVAVDLVKTWWPRAVVVPYGQIGVGAQHLHVDGTGVAPYRGTTDDDWSVVTTAGIGLSARIVSRFWIAADAHALVGWPPAAVRIAGEEVGRFGGPALLVDAGLWGQIP